MDGEYDDDDYETDYDYDDYYDDDDDDEYISPADLLASSMLHSRAVQLVSLSSLNDERQKRWKVLAKPFMQLRCKHHFNLWLSLYVFVKISNCHSKLSFIYIVFPSSRTACLIFRRNVIAFRNIEIG